MSGKFTPGPWVCEFGADGYWFVGHGLDGEAELDSPYDANARLIAAAPDLLEALISARGSTEWSCMEREVQDRVTDAISKALGEQGQ